MTAVCPAEEPDVDPTIRTPVRRYLNQGLDITVLRTVIHLVQGRVPAAVRVVPPAVHRGAVQDHFTVVAESTSRVTRKFGDDQEITRRVEATADTGKERIRIADQGCRVHPNTGQRML